MRLVAELDWLWDSLWVHLKEMSLEWCLGSYYPNVWMGKMWERLLEATMGLMSVDGKLENSMDCALGLDLRLVAELDWL